MCAAGVTMERARALRSVVAPINPTPANLAFLLVVLATVYGMLTRMVRLPGFDDAGRIVWIVALTGAYFGKLLPPYKAADSQQKGMQGLFAAKSTGGCAVS